MASGEHLSNSPELVIVGSSNVRTNKPPPALDAATVQSKLKAGTLNLIRIVDRSTRSFIYDYISRVHDPEDHVDLNFFACNKCKTAFVIDPTGGTGKYSSHLKKKHGITGRHKNDEATDPKQPRLSTHFPTASVSKNHSDRIIDGILKLCIDRCLPFDVGCSDSMMDLLAVTLKIDGFPKSEQEKIFKLCDESTLRKNRLPEKFDQVRAKVKSKVEADCSGSGGVTVDLWSDKYRHREYIAVTLHYLDKNFLLNSYCLSCRQVFDAKITNVVITRLIKSILAEYGLDPKNMIFVSDSGPNVKTAFDTNGWIRIACFAHDLDLLVSTDGFGKSEAQTKSVTEDAQSIPQIRELIRDCKAVVSHFKRGNGQRK